MLPGAMACEQEVSAVAKPRRFGTGQRRCRHVGISPACLRPAEALKIARPSPIRPISGQFRWWSWSDPDDTDHPISEQASGRNRAARSSK
jgi:hypothetical protein